MLDERIARFAPRQSKGISYREAGAGPALVLLHGIGSSSASWLFQLESLAGYRLIAWDAPGYGASAFLAMAEPQPADYAQALHEFLERLLLKDVVLVGNSLGCLMALWRDQTFQALALTVLALVLYLCLVRGIAPNRSATSRMRKVFRRAGCRHRKDRPCPRTRLGARAKDLR